MTKSRWSPALALLLCASGVATAGIYLPSEESYLVGRDGKPEPMPFDAFRVVMTDYESIYDQWRPQPSAKRLEYLQRKADLTERMKSGRTMMDEMIARGAVLMRLRDNEALNDLQAARARDPRNFIVQTHLALLFHRLGEPDSIRYQQDALSLRPRQVLGMTEAQTAWYLRVERVLLELMKARYRERLQYGPRAEVESLDPLFPVQFVGESGTYEAGAVAAAEKAKLPDDALAVVQQLLLWMPEDVRLYWLLAELYNAQGDLATAARIFDECIDARRFHAKPLSEHRRIVKDALAEQLARAQQRPPSWLDHPEIIWGAVAIGLLILLPFVFWQIRELRRRFRGACRTGL